MRRRQKASKPDTDTSAAVDAFLGKLEHPLKTEIGELRRIILKADKRIGEGVKWNAPSFRLDEYFATLNLRSTGSLQVIFHLGAKVKDNSTRRTKIDDPEGLLKWLAKERCLADFGRLKDIRARRAEITAIVRQWIRQP